MFGKKLKCGLISTEFLDSLLIEYFERMWHRHCHLEGWLLLVMCRKSSGSFTSRDSGIEIKHFLSYLSFFLQSLYFAFFRCESLLWFRRSKIYFFCHFLLYFS